MRQGSGPRHCGNSPTAGAEEFWHACGVYTARVTAEGRLLIEASERLSTAEALRMISQGFALADAGGLTEIVADVRQVRRGPGQWLVLGAVVASRMEPMMRLAVIAEPRQAAVVRRILRYSGLRDRAQLVGDEAEALRWLATRRKGRSSGRQEEVAPARMEAAEEEIRPTAG